MNIDFSKYHGTGNDFVLIDDRDRKFPVNDQKLIERMCDRHFGIGADGLILLQNSENTHFNMVYFNADGNQSSMCGNGGRCITAFARVLGIQGSEYLFTAIDGVHKSIIESSGNILLKMSDINILENYNNNGKIIQTGSPHLVFLSKHVDELDLISEARKYRYNNQFKNEGINVNFVQMNENGVYMRTYERGVEDETLSCGTGTVAVAAMLALEDQDYQSHSWIDIHTKGGKLAVRFEKQNEIGRLTNVWLKGPAKFVYEGSYSI